MPILGMGVFEIAFLVTSFVSGVSSMFSQPKKPKVQRSAQDIYFEQRVQVGRILMKKKQTVNNFMKMFLDPTRATPTSLAVMRASGAAPQSKLGTTAFDLEWSKFIGETDFGYIEGAGLYESVGKGSSEYYKRSDVNATYAPGTKEKFFGKQDTPVTTTGVSPSNPSPLQGGATRSGVSPAGKGGNQ